MPCYRPLHGRRDSAGRVRFSNRSRHQISEGCVTVSCGQCIGCRVERTRQWAARIMHEASLHEANSFVTFTYDDEHLPPGGTLQLRDWQLFAKRFRAKGQPLRFFHCGEYGDEKRRPHYHAAIFGHDFSQDRKHYKTKNGNKLYTSQSLQETWQNGNVIIGELAFDSAAYIAQYITKKINGPKRTSIDKRTGLSHYESVDHQTGEIIELKPEYATMSRRPGIGSGWFDKWQDQVFPRDEIIVNGHISLPPKFYVQLRERTHPLEIADLKEQRSAKAAEHSEDQTPARLRVRERVRLAAHAEGAPREPGEVI